MSAEAAEKKYTPSQERGRAIHFMGVLAASETEQQLDGDWEARLLMEQLKAPRSV